MEVEILQQIQDELKSINKRLDNCATKDDLKNCATKDDLKQLDKKFETKFDALETRFDAFETKFNAFETRFDIFETKFNAFETRFDIFETKFNAFETKLESINQRVLIMEHELTTKVQILLETNVDTRVNYDKLRMNVAKLNEVTEMHTMQIDFIRDKINS